MKATRDAYGEALCQLGEINKNIVVLDADVSTSTRTSLFAQKFPERFFNFGIAEANMFSAAAGLAICGKIPFATTFAVFASTRALNQVRTCIAYTKLNVKIVGTHCGISIGEDGATHQAIEDITLMRSLPNIKVFHPADEIETKKLIFKVAEDKGPCYIRLGRIKVKNVMPEDFEFEIGKGFVLKKGNDIGIIATGIMVEMASDAAEELKNEGIDCEVCNISTIKPIDQEYIQNLASRVRGIVVCEEHTIIGGLGAAVLEVLRNIPKPVEFVGIEDKFGISGEPEALLRRFNLSKEVIKNKVYKLWEKSYELIL